MLGVEFLSRSRTTPRSATRRSGTGPTSSLVRYSGRSTPPLTAGAFATHTLAVVCRASDDHDDTGDNDDTTTTPTFSFAGATTVCVAEVPTIVISFANTFPELAGVTGTLTMTDINGTVVSTQPLVYQPNTTVDLLYPGTRGQRRRVDRRRPRLEPQRRWLLGP